VTVSAYRLTPPNDPPEGAPKGAPKGAFPPGREDLPYQVEVWDAAETQFEQVLAVTSSATIGYAAYYAAIREFPSSVIVLRHRGRLLSRWTGRTH
jgi:hypothetical protein